MTMTMTMTMKMIIEMKTHPKWFLILGSLHPLLLLKVHSLINSHPSLFYSQSSILKLNLSLKNLSFTWSSSFPLSLSRGCLFHTTRAHTASSFSFRWNPTPWRNNHLRRLVILRHTSPPMLVALWNKRHVTHPRRWERHSETKDKVVSTWDDALVSICLSWQSQ